MAIKKERKRFQDYTLDERQDIWNTLHQALDEGGHDILAQDLLANLPDDEADYMKNEQFYGIAFDKTNFKDVYVINIINGNTLDAGESIDFDKIIEDGRKNNDQQSVLLETPMDKSMTKKTSFPETLKINGEEWYLVDMVDGVEYRPQSTNYEDNWLEVSRDNCFYLYMDHRIVSQKEDVSGNVVSALREFVKDISKSVKKNGMDIDDPDFDKTEEMLFDLESKLWHSPTGNVAWDDLKAYDDLHLKYSGRHFIPNYEMMDNMDARAVVDDYLHYVAWSNHGNESHWMEFPEFLFEPYLNPNEILDLMEEQGDMEFYDTDDNVKRVVDMLRSVKKSKTMKAQILYGAFSGDEKHFYERILELAEENCPHATKIYAGFSVDVVWDLPSGNHPGLFLSEHGTDDNKFYVGSVTAWKFLDFPENTPDGEMPAKMGEMAHIMHTQSNNGGISESELIGYMQKMDAMCAELQSIQKSKMKKGQSVFAVWVEGERYDKTEGNINVAGGDMLFGTLEEASRRMWELNRQGYKQKDLNVIEIDREAYEDPESYEPEDYEIRWYEPKELKMYKSKTEKDEKKVPITDDDTVEIEEMDGEKYVEIEPKEEHAEEVETGYEKESDDLNTEDNITHPDTSKPKEKSEKSKTEKSLIDFTEGMTVRDFFERNKRGGNSIMGFDLYSLNFDGRQVGTNYTGVKPEYMDYIVDSYDMDDFLGLLDINIRKSKETVMLDRLTPAQAVQKCAQFQKENKRNGLMQDEVYELTGYNAESLFLPMMKRGQVTKHKCADGFIYNIRM